MEYTLKIQSPLGEITLASDGESLTGLWLANQSYFAATLAEHAQQKELAIFTRVQEWLERYFAGDQPERTFSLAPKGTPFRQAVWQELCKLPYGSVTTYADIAHRLENSQPGSKTSARAVGGAVAHNPISIIIPCHRVIGKSGALVGYAGGVEAKRTLLTLEKAPI